GKYTGTDYTSLSAWGQAVKGDANSKSVNPFFKSTTELRAYQRALNGAGIPVAGVVLDIDGEIRNSSAPDIGADEFMVDFGITRLISPTLDCDQTATEAVTANIAQFGDIPFTDLKIAYQVNKGTIYTETIKGQINTDIAHTFQQVQNLLQDGRYDFKVWLVGIQDDNVNNDTLYVARFKKPRPNASFNFKAECAGVAVSFQGNASVNPGKIARYEWDFGDGEMAHEQNPKHIFAKSGTYTVTLRAYSEEGCYGSVTREVTITTTPEAKFSAANSCAGAPLTFKNESTVSAGTITYLWDFGDGTSSTEQHPTKTYSKAGTYKVQLTASNNSGCSNVYFKNVVVNELPAVTFATFNPVCAEAPAFNLTGGLPKGGIYSGKGVVDGMFNATTAGIGTHTIIYTYTNENGCISTATNTIQVKALPTVSFSGLPATICSSAAAVTLTASPAGGVWVGNGMNKDGVFTPATAGVGTHNVEYIYSDAGGCTNKVTKTVEVTSVTGTLTASSNSPVKIGETLNLSASTITGATYSWTGPNSFTSTSQNPFIANVTSKAAGAYTVTATVDGCRISAIIDVVIDQPTVIASFSPINGIEGTSVTIKGSGFTGATRVQFRNASANGFKIVDDETIVVAAPGCCTGPISVTTSTGTVVSKEVFTVLDNTITISTLPNGATYCAGGSINIPFTVTGTYTSGNSFTAQLSNASGSFASPVNIGTMSGTASGTISATIPAGTTLGNGYRVRVISASPAIISGDNGANLSVQNKPAAPGAITGVTSICNGSEVTYTITAVSGATSYEWTVPNGWGITSGEGTTSIKVTVGSTGGNITVTATNYCGTSSASTKAVSITTVTAPTVSANTPQVGETLNLTAGSISGATYSWTGPLGFTSTEQNPTRANATAAMAGTYSVTATVNGCTSAAATVTVTVGEANALTIAVDSVSGSSNAEVLVPVRVKDFKNILSMQGSINWNSSIATFVGVESFGLEGMSSASFGQTNVTNGQLTFSWHEASSTPVILSDDAVIFALRLKLVGAAGSSTAVTVTNTPVKIEVTNNSFTAIPVTTKVGAAIIASEVTVAGTVKSQLGTSLTNVTVRATGGANSKSITTGASGAFSFDLTEGASYTLAPTRRTEVDVTNGITTLDLVQIQRHILGMQSLASPYKIIAADVNNSGSVTTLDVALIRALILYNITSFPKERMWAFVKSDYSFADPTMPFPYDSTRVYSKAAGLSSQNFIGVKLGDVNDSWDASTARLKVAGEVAFNMEDQLTAPGTEIVVPVSVQNFSDVCGYQFTLSWDPKVLEFSRVEHAGVESVYGTHSIGKGKLTTVWAEPNGRSLSLTDGTKVFYVRFKVVGENGAESKVEIGSALTKSVAYTGSLAQLNVQSQHAVVKVKAPTYALFQNYPNPFNSQTTLHFELAEEQEVQFTIYNALGQVVKQISGKYAAGEHTVVWKGDDGKGNRLSKGTYYCRMQAGKYTNAVQIILAK
ncbi:PKD domain-containing protein, partial [Pontibacter aydingkolensis]